MLGPARLRIGESPYTWLSPVRAPFFGKHLSMVTRVLAYSIGSIVSVLAVSNILGPVMVDYGGEQAVVIFGVILGCLTAFVKPVLSILTLPITCLTFGLFALVLNAALFAVAARLTPELDVSVLGALIGGVFVAVINGVIFSVANDS
jgi:putative membrane protein